MRLNQFLAHALGISRRQADRDIEAGLVSIGERRASLGDQVAPDSIEVVYKRKSVRPRTDRPTTIALHKPAGYITSRTHDPAARSAHSSVDDPIVMDLLPREYQHLRPIGRLDKESEGLLLLTDDGDLLYRSTHPKFETEKEYLVEFADHVPESLIASWVRGVPLPEGVAKADRVERKSRKVLSVVIHQGFNRQLRRMAGASGAAIVRLRRVRVGTVALGDLAPGKWKTV
jgi:pseudouridine synthase